MGLEFLVDWLQFNKTWLFSGVGGTLICGVTTFLFHRETRKNQKATVKEPEGPVTIIQMNDDSKVHLETVERSSANIQVVGVTIIEVEGCSPILDVKFRNKGDEVAFVKKVEFKTLGHWAISTDRLPSLREVSAKYDLLVDRAISSVCSVNVSHEVKPQETDRIRVRLSTDFKDDPLGLSLFLLAGTLVFNESDTRSEIPTLLTDISPPVVVQASYFPGYDDSTIVHNKRVAREVLGLITSHVVVQEDIEGALLSWIDAPDVV